MLPKIQITWKNGSNKSYGELNFLQKTQRAHMSISLRSRTRGLGILKYYWVNISIAQILGVFSPFWKYPFSIFFLEHVVDEFWKTNPRLVLQETPPHRSLEAFCPLRWNFCPLRWNFCPLWRNYRTLWWNHDAILYIMAPHSWIFHFKVEHC